MRSYAILGTGAIGSFCAVLLHHAGLEVHCLLGRDYKHVNSQGLTLIKKEGKLTASIQAYDDVQKMPKCDVVVVALKTTMNEKLKSWLPHLMKENSTVLVLQNGIGVEEELSSFVSSEQIVGGACGLIVNKRGVGLFEHVSMNEIEFSQYYTDPKKKGVTQRVKEVAADFSKAGVEAILEEHLWSVRWKKVIRNFPSNGLSVVLGASYAEMTGNPMSFDLLCRMTQEMILAAKKAGADISEDFYEERVGQFESFKELEGSYPSTKVDFDAKRPLELQAIFENPVKIAHRYKASVPFMEMLYAELVFLNEKNLLR